MIKRKLRSEKGASITFALLIFLVCAVVSSVVIVAATTASGRVSKQAETDARYYSVTSAAELLKDLVNGKTATVKRTVVNETTYTVTDDGVTAETSKDTSDSTSIYLGEELQGIIKKELGSGDIYISDITHAGDIKKSFLADAALKVVKTTDLGTGYDAYASNAIDGMTSRNLTLSVDGVNSLGAVITEDLYPDGKLVFTITNADLNGGSYQISTSPYTLILTFNAVKDEDKDKSSVDTEVSLNGDKKSYKTITTTTTTTTIDWTLSDIKTGSVPVETEPEP